MKIPDNTPDQKIQSGVQDGKSEKEEESLSSDGYERRRVHRRSEFKKHVHIASVGGLWLGFSFYAIAMFSWLYHLLAPINWQFMPMDNIITLQNLLFGTIVGGLISQFARKIFSDD